MGLKLHRGAQRRRRTASDGDGLRRRGRRRSAPGSDEVVLYATGSSARQTEATDERPCDAIVMAIVDSWELDGEEVYRK